MRLLLEPLNNRIDHVGFFMGSAIEGLDISKAAVIAEYVQQYYATGTFIPDEVFVGVDIEEGRARPRRHRRR